MLGHLGRHWIALLMIVSQCNRAALIADLISRRRLGSKARLDRQRVRSSPPSLPRIQPYRNWHSQFLPGTLRSNTEQFRHIERAPAKAFGSATRTINENTIFWIRSALG